MSEPDVTLPRRSSAEVAKLIGEVMAAQLRVAAAARGMSYEQAQFRPAPDAWTVPQVLEHMFLASQAGINLIWRAAEAAGRGTPLWTGEHTNIGLSIEEVIARTWRLTEPGLRTWNTDEIAPENATPRSGGAVAYWLANLETNLTVLGRLQPILEGLDLDQVIAPHVISGPLDARQRLEFLRWHLDHHLQQIESIQSHPGFADNH